MQGSASAEIEVPPEDERKGSLIVATLVLAVIHNCCLMASGGLYSRWPIIISCAALMGWLGVLLLPSAWLPRVSVVRVAGVACGLGLFVQLGIVAMSRPADLGVLTLKSELLEWQVMLSLVAVVLVFGLCLKRKPPVWTGVAVVALAFGAVAAAVIHSETPVIDVLTWQQVALERLCGGVNPYRPPMPDVYLGQADALYPPGLVTHGGWIRTGIVYPPSTLLLTLPGYVMGGDVRWAHLGWLCAGFVLLVVMKPTRLALAATALLLFSPIIYRVIIYAWTEPLLVFGLSLVVCSALKQRCLLPYAVGVMISLKQYGVILLPLTLLLIPRPWGAATIGRFYITAIAVAVAVTLPFAVWDFNAFVNSTVIYHLKSPFREDSIGLLPMAGDAGRTAAAGLLAPLSILVLTPLLLLRMPRDVFGFAASAGVLSMTFFLLSKQSFMNYHFFSVSALLIGVAVSGSERPTAQVTPL